MCARMGVVTGKGLSALIRVEFGLRITFVIASACYIAYIMAGVLSRPDWHLAMVETVKLPPRSVWSDKAYIYMTVGVIGTTIAPWMQFYLQSSIVDKGVNVKQYKASR